MLQLLENQRSGTLADHEAVAVLVKGTRSVLRVVVARRKRLHGVETADRRLVYGSLRTSGHHDVGLAVANGLHGGNHTVVRRCTGRNRTVVRAHESVFHRDEAGGNVGNHAGNEEGAKPRGSIPGGIAQTLVEERFESSDTRAPDYADLLLVDLLQVKARILYGLRSGDQSILREEVVLADLLAVEMLGRVVILHFTSEARLKFFSVEMSNGCGTAYALLQIRKILFNIIAERVDRTDARNYYSSSCHKFKASCRETKLIL